MSRVLRAVLSAVAVFSAAAAVPVLAQSDPKIVHPEDGEWKPLSPKQTVGGPVIHVVWGDPLKREGGFLLKLPSDGELPERVQKAAYTVVVVSGTWLHAVDDDQPAEVRPGGYYTQRPKQRHRDRCLAGPDCVVLIRTATGFDLKPVKQDVTGTVKPQVPAKK